MDMEHLDKWAKIKGIDILGTGDFTHPEWFNELKTKLKPLGNGLYQLKNQATKFILTTELSCIYSKVNKVRRIHILIFAPDLSTVEKINTQLGLRGNLKSDGRPILGMDAEELAKIVFDASENTMVIPAHAWTPWFSIFGSKSGFDTIEECFGKLTPYIYSIETGLSSDPAMNWRLSALDKITLISNSDAHSPKNLGREANVFEFKKEPSYQDITGAIKNKNKGNLKYTIEFFPKKVNIIGTGIELVILGSRRKRLRNIMVFARFAVNL
jgi:PHP family Zn ribbon phosphoesterase